VIILPAIRSKRINEVSKQISEVLKCRIDGSGSIYKRMCRAKRNKEPYIIVRPDTPQTHKVTYNDCSVKIDININKAIKLARRL
jgi:hypothetical protein